MRWLSFLLDARCACFYCDSEEEAVEQVRRAYEHVLGGVERVDTTGPDQAAHTYKALNEPENIRRAERGEYALKWEGPPPPAGPWSATYEPASFNDEDAPVHAERGALVLKRTRVVGQESRELPESVIERRVGISRFHGGVLLKVWTLDEDYWPEDDMVMVADYLIDRGSRQPGAGSARRGQRVPTAKKVPVEAGDDD